MRKVMLIALALLAACAHGGGRARPVYLIAEVEVVNPELYARYAESVPAIIKKYGGRYLVRGGRVSPMSGDWNPQRLIVMEFESAEQLKRCFASPEYLEILPLREQSTASRAIVVEGYSPPE
jgi:uncharacterized protein (DUF1330 family)